MMVIVSSCGAWNLVQHMMNFTVLSSFGLPIDGISL